VLSGSRSKTQKNVEKLKNVLPGDMEFPEAFALSGMCICIHSSDRLD
jgi:hypothetical protein